MIVIKQQMDSSLTATQQAVIRNLWLNYYNNTLLEKGIISKDEHRKMKIKINNKYPAQKL